MACRSSSLALRLGACAGLTYELRCRRATPSSSAPIVTQKWLVSCSVRETGLACKQAREKKVESVRGALCVPPPGSFVNRTHAPLNLFVRGVGAQHTNQTKMEKAFCLCRVFLLPPPLFVTRVVSCTKQIKKIEKRGIRPSPPGGVVFILFFVYIFLFHQKISELSVCSMTRVVSRNAADAPTKRECDIFSI